MTPTYFPCECIWIITLIIINIPERRKVTEEVLCFLFKSSRCCLSVNSPLSQRNRKWSCCAGSWGRMSCTLSRNYSRRKEGRRDRVNFNTRKTFREIFKWIFTVMSLEVKKKKKKQVSVYVFTEELFISDHQVLFTNSAEACDSVTDHFTHFKGNV